MRIILEGADLTGKSTLAKRLEKDFDLSYVHIIRKDSHSKEFYLNLLDKHDVIFDRHFIGESIYPYLFKREAKFGKDGFNEIKNRALELGYKIVVVFATEEQLLSRLKERNNEPEDVVKTLLEANKRFVDRALENGFILINVEDMSYENILKKLGCD